MARRTAAAFVALIVSFAPWAAASQAAPELEMSADGEIQVARDGSVSDYRLESALPPAVAALVDRDVRRWLFEPVVVDGEAVVAKSAMHLALRAEPVDGTDQYRVRIANIYFGAPRHNDSTRPPRYPHAAVAAHLGARVLLAVRFDETGKVVDAAPYQTSLDARTRSEKEAEHWRKLFEQASVAAARQWRYDPSETINGKPIGARAIVPIVYSLRDLGSAPQPGKWKAYVPGPVYDVPWLDSQHVADSQGLADLPDDVSLPVDSHLHLRGNVIGSLL
jgi:hypothetical protein